MIFILKYVVMSYSIYGINKIANKNIDNKNDLVAEIKRITC